MDERAVKEACILIVDDQEANVRLLERLLEVSRFTGLVSTTDSSRVVQLCVEHQPDIVLLDLQMPTPDGFEVMELLEPWRKGTPRLPILVLTADGTRETKMRALSAGAGDFLSKPFDTSEVILRVENLLKVRLLELELVDQNALLERRVQSRTRELEEARIDVVDRLALVAEYRDDATGEHAHRIGRLSALVARELDMSEEWTGLIRLAAPLHDIGKLALADDILVKPESLTPVEFEAVKAHVIVGHEILGRSRSPLLQMSAQIALTHHERWDGSGYVSGLKGEDIPLAGRIVAVVDYFETMTQERRRSSEQALAEIRHGSGRTYDPQVVEAFAGIVSALRGEATEWNTVSLPERPRANSAPAGRR